MSVGDIILAKDRNDWSLGRIEEVTRGSHGKVRSGKVKICKEGNAKSYDHPNSSFVLILKREEEG